MRLKNPTPLQSDETDGLYELSKIKPSISTVLFFSKEIKNLHEYNNKCHLALEKNIFRFSQKPLDSAVAS